MMTFFGGLLFSQQITRLAVVDYSRLLSVYYQDSRKIKEVNDFENQIIEELERFGGFGVINGDRAHVIADEGPAILEDETPPQAERHHVGRRG